MFGVPFQEPGIRRPTWFPDIFNSLGRGESIEIRSKKWVGEKVSRESLSLGLEDSSSILFAVKSYGRLGTLRDLYKPQEKNGSRPRTFSSVSG